MNRTFFRAVREFKVQCVDHMNAGSKDQEAVHRSAQLYSPILIDELSLSAHMVYKRIPSNGPEVMIQTDPVDRGWWSVHLCNDKCESRKVAP